jgi:hypothetical protein
LAHLHTAKQTSPDTAIESSRPGLALPVPSYCSAAPCVPGSRPRWTTASGSRTSLTSDTQGPNWPASFSLASSSSPAARTATPLSSWLGAIGCSRGRAHPGLHAG